MAEPFVRFDQNDRLSWTSPFDFLVDLFRWLFILSVTLVVLALLLRILGERPGHAAHEIKEGWIMEASTESPPGFDSPHWSRVSLPDDWRYVPRKGVRHAWYRFELSLPNTGQELWAGYLPSMSMNAALFINGELVGQDGHFGEQITRNWNKPLYFTLPKSLLHSGKNEILVRVAAVPGGSGLLAPFYLGERLDLRPYYRSRQIMKSTLPIVASIAAGLLAFASLMVYFNSRKHRVYFWYGFGTMVWAIHNMNLFVNEPPVSNLLWDWFWYSSLGWFIVAIPPYVHGLLGYERPRLERALFGYAILGTVGLGALATNDHVLMDFVARRIWTVSWLGIGLYPTFLMIYAVWRSRDIETQWLLTAALLIFVLGIHDCLMSNGWLSRVDGYLMHYSIPVVIAVFGWLLLSRYVRSIGEVEALNRDLHRRVEERTAELEKSFAHASELERDRAIQSERERILRDMHDGVGGHLVAAVAMAEGGEADSEELAETIRDTLDELRLTIDSLDLEQGDLASALGTLRARLSPAFATDQPSLSWEMDALPETPHLGPAMLTHIVRIVREAVSNALRHAGARNIWVRIRPDPSSGKSRVRIEIEDDGQGIHDHEHAGHGLTNMRHRAELLSANLEILSSRTGTKIVLLINA